MKKSLTPSPSPKGEGSIMKKTELTNKIYDEEDSYCNAFLDGIWSS